LENFRAVIFDGRFRQLPNFLRAILDAHLLETFVERSSILLCQLPNVCLICWKTFVQ